MPDRNRERFILILRWFVAAIFILAGASKIMDPQIFARDIDNYRILPYLVVTIMAIIFPWLEVISGVLLVVGKWKKGAALILLALAFMFLIAISSAIDRGLDITCGCFSMSIEGTRVGYARLIEDGILFVVILLINIKLIKS